MRWKNFIPFLIIIIAGTVIYLFFLDTFLKMGIEGMGTKAAGAKVEVRKAHFDILKLSMSINDLKVGNKNDEWRNLFEAGSIKFALQGWPLFQRKFIIDEMSAQGIKWNTVRKTSCKILERKKKQEDAGREVGDAKTSSPSLTQTLAKKIDLKSYFDINKLSCISSITGMKADIDTKTARWQKELASDDLKAQADNVGKTVSEVKISSGMSLEEAKAALNKLNEAKQSLDKLKQEYDTKKSMFDSDYKAVSGYKDKIEELKNFDLKKMKNELTGGIQTENIAKSLFGPVWVGRVNNGIYWIDKSRKYMPKKVKIKLPKRSKGVWVGFPSKNNLPRFLIKKILLSGEAPNGVQFSGTILGVTTNPSVYGAPMIIDIKMWFPNINIEKTFAQFRAVLDHTKKEAEDNFILVARNFPMKEFSLGQSDYLPTTAHIKSADINMALALKEKNLDSNIELGFNNVGFSYPENSAQDEYTKIIGEVLNNIGRLNLAGRLYGPIDSLKFEMRSSMDNILSQKLNEIAGKRLKEEEEKIRAEIDRAANQGRQEFQAKADELKNQTQGKLDSYKASIDSNLAAAQAKIDEIKKQAEASLNKEKEKAAEQINKEGQKLLKGIFGK